MSYPPVVDPGLATSPKRNSPILFDTEGLEKIRLAECGGGRGEE